MNRKNLWLNRLTAVLLSFGMAVMPAVLNAGVSYADVKAAVPTKSSVALAEAKTVATDSTPTASNATVSINETSVTLEVGASKTLTVTASPSDAVRQWSSNNTAVATVNNGVVTGVAEGTATITVTLTGIASPSDAAKLTDSVTVTVEDPKPVNPSIILNKTELTLEEGQSEKLTATTVPEGATVSWHSNNETLVTVASDGTVHAVKAGTTEIVAQIQGTWGLKEATCKVTVTAPSVNLKELKLNVTELLLKVDGTAKITTADVPEGTKAGWTCDDAEVVEIKDGSAAGVTVTGLKEGTATITADIEGYKPASVTVTVLPKEAAVITAPGKISVVDASKIDLSDIPADALDDAESAVWTALSEITLNDSVLNFKAKGLLEALNIVLEDGQIAVSRVDSKLTDMEVKAEEKDDQWIIRPTKLVYESGIFMNILDENGLLVKEDQKVLNTQLNRGKEIKFRLAIPSAVNKKYAQVVHRSDDYRDDYIRNIEINKLGKDDAYIELSVSHFSEFEITFTDEKVSTGTDGSSSGGSGGTPYYGSYGTPKKQAPGQWVQDETGWWYKNADGTYPSNCWVQLSWGETSSWYRFNEQGYMVTGWFLDTDGNYYFLHNVSDGTQGYMYTGWHQINGIWYYFRDNAGGPMGSLIVNGTTPDGFQTDANGAWIQ